MGGKSSSNIVGYKYFFGIHMGIGRGPVDALHEIRIGDKRAWKDTATGNMTIRINKPDLFGGQDREGGIQGSLELMMGGPTQTASSGLQAMLGTLLPGFRGVFTAFYNGLISCNNPYPKAWKFRLNRTLAGWDGAVWNPDKCRILLENGEDSGAPINLPESLLVSLWAWRRDSGAYDSYNIANTEEPTWESYFGELGSENALLRMVNYTELGVADTGVMPTKTVPIDPDRSYELIVGSDAGVEGLEDVAEAQFEFLDASGNVIAAMVFEMVPFTVQHRLKLGTSLDTLFNVPLTEEVSTWGTLVMSPGQLILTRKFISSNTGFTFDCDAMSIRQVRISNARVASTYTGGTPDPRVRIVLQKTPMELPGVAAYAMNAAHIIYEALTNRVWGRGLPASKLDLASFTEAAETLFSEGFGLCIKWTRKDSIESFVQGILDHIGAVLFVSRTTKLYTLRLIRDNYELSDLTAFTTENGIIEIREATVAVVGSSVNAVTVTYHDWRTDEDRTVSVKNIAAMRAGGGVMNSASKSYPGIPNADLALRIAQRDLKAASTNLRRFTLVMDRRAESVEPGSVIAIEDAARGIQKMAVRVGRVEDGTITDGRITLSVVQDVFSFPYASFATDVPGTWVPPNTTPCIDEQEVVEAPYFLMASRMKPADLAYVSDDGGYLMTLNSQGQSLNQGYKIAVRDGEPTPDDNPSGESYFCG